MKWLKADATLKHATFVVKMMPRSDEQTAGNFRRVSESVSTRSLYGRKKKQEFYLEEVDWHSPDESPMALDFHQIAGRGPHRVGNDRAEPDPLSRLHDKLAVIYIDGNKFGKQQVRRPVPMRSLRRQSRRLLVMRSCCD